MRWGISTCQSTTEKETSSGTTAHVSVVYVWCFIETKTYYRTYAIHALDMSISYVKLGVNDKTCTASIFNCLFDLRAPGG